MEPHIHLNPVSLVNGHYDGPLDTVAILTWARRRVDGPWLVVERGVCHPARGSSLISHAGVAVRSAATRCGAQQIAASLYRQSAARGILSVAYTVVAREAVTIRAERGPYGCTSGESTAL